MNKILRSIIIVIAALVLSPWGWVFAPGDAKESQPVLSLAVAPAVESRSSLTVPLLDEPALPAPPQAIVPKYLAYSSYLYIPTHAEQRQPLQVMIALHGMGGEGKSFGATMIKEAERNGWLLVAPTIAYGDWLNPEKVAAEDIENTRRLIATIDDLPSRTNLALKQRVDIYGFSRGAQLAHRFAIFFPERVDRVVAFSAGTYTLPYREKTFPGDGRADTMILPYGVSDLERRLGKPLNLYRLREVQFMVGVGAADNVSADVPRQWDEYLGKNRVERARAFARTLQGHGVPCALQVYPAVGHELTQLMLNQAVTFFAGPVSSYYPLLP